MRCKKCGASLRTGTRVCPHCGEKVVIERVGRSEFTWDVDDLPKPSAGKKKTGKDFLSWSDEGSRVDSVREKKDNKPNARGAFVWPDDPDDPLTRKMKERQAAQEDSSEKFHSREEKMKKLRQESTEKFKWDSPQESRTSGRGSRISSNFLTWGETEQPAALKAKNRTPKTRLDMDFGEKKPAPASAASRKAPDINSGEPAGRNVLKAGTKAVLADMERDDRDRSEISREKDDFRFTIPDLGSMHTERAAAEIKHSAEAEDVEKSVFNEFRSIMDSEKLFDENLDKLSFLTEEEEAEIKAAQEKAERLTSKPQFAFDSIESEYDRYRQENGVDKALTYEEKEAQLKKLQAEINEREEQERKAQQVADAGKDAGQQNVETSGGAAAGESLVAVDSGTRRPEADTVKKPQPNKGNKEVEIKINEPSGTKVTVKTQEISIADIQDGLDVMDVKTREVDLTDLKNPAPRNVQVSVEVNGANNASVEVTRRHDGATVVKTVDNSTGRATVMDDDPNKVGGEAYTDERFWEHPTDESSRMTITDIFGPEARKLIDKFDKKQEKKKELTEDTLMLDIDPADIQLSEEQTRELLLDEDSDEFMDDLPDIDLSNVNLMEDEEYEEAAAEAAAEETDETGTEAEAGENTEPAEADEAAGEEISGEAEGDENGETDEAGEAEEADVADESRETSEVIGESEAAEESAEAEATREAGAAEEAEETGTSTEEEAKSGNGEEAEIQEEAEAEESEAETEPADMPKSESETAAELAADLTGPLAVSADIYEAAEEASTAANLDQEATAEAAPEVPEEPDFEAKPAGEIPEVGRSWQDAAGETDEPAATAETESGVVDGYAESGAAEMPAAAAEVAEPEVRDDAEDRKSAAVVSGVMAAEAMPGAAVMTEILDEDEPEAEDIPAAEDPAGYSPAENIPEEAAPTAVQEEPVPAAAGRKKKKKKKSEDRGGFSAPVKAIIAVLAVLLVLEFTVIGVKLFARDSQANVFIERVEEQFFALDGATGDSGLKM
ncbi:MAG: hypothetical protein K5767_03340 [Clostridia bacterium]|nr:hypothetical protein [Clostridia bacterium]